MTTGGAAFDPKAILRVLAKHDVDYIVIGGFAATVHASPFLTFDVDICPADDDANLRRLQAGLEELDARLRLADEPEPLGINFSPRVLRSAPFFNLMTKHGPLDIIHRPGGTDGYEDLARDAQRVELSGVTVIVASRADILRSKESIRRDKDKPTIDLFRELEERELEERSKERPEKS
jgi:hypothetical protein